MGYSIAKIWREPPPGGYDRFVEEIIAEARGRGPVQVFFRADDAGVPGRNHVQLTNLFSRLSAPLCLAVVPTWAAMHAAKFRRTVDLGSPALCIHQHGFRHCNNEPAGQKMEFGPSLSYEQKESMLSRGMDLLRKHLGDVVQPFFTPPSNNCDLEAMEAMKRVGMRGVSRCVGVRPPAPEGLPEYPVNVDLHTRRGEDPAGDRTALKEQFAAAFAAGRAGIMIHHQLMNENAFRFLESLLLGMLGDKTFLPVHFGHLADMEQDGLP